MSRVTTFPIEPHACSYFTTSPTPYFTSNCDSTLLLCLNNILCVFMQ